ncbi:MAG: FtsW/RodA/SpoVE family cell cycle protein [Bdellovibrionaceae bacterium]|nr:FtsW/RodA/SpoVE family cell cycle protein [Pseudobdellovibrionaceae bacterium]
MKSMGNEKIQKFVDEVANELSFGEARTAVRTEICSHLEDSIEMAKSYELSETDAIRNSIERMGNPKEIGKSLNQIHQPKFDFLLPLLSLSICFVGLWNLSATKWIGLQTAWMSIGALLVTGIYFLPVAKFRNLLSSLYILAALGLFASYFSGVEASGQPYLSISGLNIKIVDLSAILFALAIPTLSSRFHVSRLPGLTSILLFLVPLAYFSFNGFIWAGLLLLVSGLSFLGMQKISNLNFLGAGVVGSGMLLSRFSDGIVPIAEVNKAIVENAHTDYALRSLSAAIVAEILVAAFFVSLLLYGFRLVFTIKEQSLRSIAVVGISLLAVQIVTSVLANLGVLPMISAGINIPFVSYGGSGIIANFLIVGVLLACLKRRTLSITPA